MVRRLNLYGGDRVEEAIASLKALSQAFPGENFFVNFTNTYVFPFDTIGSYLRKMHDGGAYLKEQLESHPEYDLKEMEQAVGFDYSAKPDPAKVEEAVLHYLRSVEKERRGNMRKVADSSIYFSPVVISDDNYDSDLSVFDVSPEIEVRGLRHDGGNEVWGLVRQENLDDFDPDIDYNEDWRRLDVSELLKVLEGNKDLAEKVKAPVVLDYSIGVNGISSANQDDFSLDPATVATAVQILEPFFDKDVFGRLSLDNPIVSVETDRLCCDLALSSASGKYEVFILPPGLDEPIGRFVDYIGSDGALRYDDIINDIMVALAERDLMESNELSAEQTSQIKI